MDPLQVTVDHVENGIALLRTADGQTLRVRATDLPAGTAAGDVLACAWTKGTEDADERVRRARDILNELLGGSEQS